MSTVTPADAQLTRARYQTDGYVIFRNVLDAELVDEARRHIDWLQRRHPDRRPENLGTDLVADDPFWLRLVGDDRLLDLAGGFVGPDIALFASHYIAKPPQSGRAVLWHQDGAFWPLEPMAVVSLWLALDDTDPSNGCLRVVPGTHLWDLKPNRRRTDVANVLNAEIDVDPALIEEDKAVDIVLRAGDVEIHHPNVIHGSHANTSPRWRRGLTIRYIPTTTRIVSAEPWPSAFLLRGEAVPQINNYRSRPPYEEGRHMPFRGSDAWAARRSAARL
ncbi:MAG: phytanoyl-CoA dioxygenase family protein [Candidatus Dormibacteraeota bacterium]|nr:phytanoyl-CoA dioxygenase family protein [Candidatus Dormibacteraeota bacterium]